MTTDLDAAGDRGRSRAGNSMPRTRAAVMAATRVCLSRSGPRRSTMSDVATQAKVAKATLYNHFRTKSELLDAYVAFEVDDLLTVLTGGLPAGVADALASAADWIADHPVVVRLRTAEPEALGRALQASKESATKWQAVAERLTDLLGEGAAPVVLPWLVGLGLTPSAPAERRTAAQVIAAGLLRSHAEPAGSPSG